MESSMAETKELGSLGARERQIMDVLFRLGTAGVAEVREALAAPPTYSAVRGMLSLLEQKGFVTHKQDGVRYVYSPTLRPDAAKRRALKHLVTTFFDGSPERAVSALLGMEQDTPIDLAELRELIARRLRR
jgi:predicted transcriptional regulator